MTKQETSKVYHAILHWRDFRLKVFLEGIVIGLISGVIIVLFRYSIEKAEHLRNAVYGQLHDNLFLAVAWFIALLLAALLLGLFVKYEPMAGGSGIPQVKGTILRLLKMNWQRIIISKFFGGILAIGSGLSLGREGPSIQLGAAIGQGLSRMMGRTRMEERYLITSGASAGLAAAFNAPLAGVIFALEELHKNFSPAVLMSVMAASITADFVTLIFFGQHPVFNFVGLPVLPFHYYGYLILLGVLTGFSGILFNKTLIKTLDWYDKQRFLPKISHAAFPLLIGGVVGFFLPEILGGGHELISTVVAGRFGLLMLLVLVIAKFSFTMISYGSGVPGGIFLPLLVIGALLGALFGNIGAHLMVIDPFYSSNFVVLAMAAFFTAIVKAPITGSILITEMTGSFNHLFSLITVSMTAYVIADIMKTKPIYEELLDRILVKKGHSPVQDAAKARMIAEVVVCVGSQLDGKKVKDIEWPPQCLLVSIRRGELELVPNGETKIIAGDFLHVLIDKKHVPSISALAGECLSSP